MKDTPDWQLMYQVKEGNRSAFAEIFRRHAGPLLNFVVRYVGARAVGEELVQEIFFKLYRAAPRYEKRAAFKTFLYRIATNHCLNTLRKGEHRESFSSLDDDRQGCGSALTLRDERNAGAEQRMMLKDRMKLVERSLSSLPENQRSAVLLHKIQGLSYKEVADTLNVSVGAVKSLISRARNTLKSKLEEHHA